MIITDTNIWYNFVKYDEATLISKLKINNLCCTYINLIELGSSPRIYNNSGLSKLTVNRLLKTFKYYNHLNPWDHILSLEYPEYNFDFSFSCAMMDSCRKYISSDYEDQVDERAKSEGIVSLVKEMRNPFDVFAAYTNEKLEKIRKNITNRTEHIQQRKDNIDGIKDWTKFMIGIHTKGTINLSDNFDWSKIDLFLKVTNRYFLELEVSMNQKFRPNDFYDLLNIAYVGKNDLYWTHEKKWNRIIKEVGHESKLLNSTYLLY